MEPECRQCDLRKAVEEADQHREAQEKVPQPEDQEDLHGFTINYSFKKKKKLSWKNCYACKKGSWSSVLFVSFWQLAKIPLTLSLIMLRLSTQMAFYKKIVLLKKVSKIGLNGFAWFSCRPAVPYLTKLQAAIRGKTWHIGLGKESRRWRGSWEGKNIFRWLMTQQEAKTLFLCFFGKHRTRVGRRNCLQMDFFWKLTKWWDLIFNNLLVVQDL